jgi:hypothetical protein
VSQSSEQPGCSVTMSHGKPTGRVMMSSRSIGSPTLLKSLEDVDCELRQSDLEDVNSLHWSFRGANAVIHCAARYPRAPKSLAEEMKTATRLTENLGEVQKRNAVRWSFK